MRGDRGRGGGGIRRGQGGIPGGRRRRSRRLRGIPGLTKLVVRQLPPRLREEAFYEAGAPYGLHKAKWKVFFPGQEAVRQTSPSKPAYAYVAFTQLADAVEFQKGFQGYRFVNGRTGIESFATVERAPFQVVPRPMRRQLLTNDGAIESDSVYQTFLAEYEKEQKAEKSRGNVTLGQTASLFASGSTSQEASNDSDAKGKNGTAIVTPLIKDVRAKRRERDARKTSTIGNGGKGSKKKSVKEPKVVQRVHPVTPGRPKGKRPDTVLKKDRYSTSTSASPRPASSKTAASGPGSVVRVSTAVVGSKKKLTRTERRKLKQRQEQQRQMNDKHRARTARTSGKGGKGKVKTTATVDSDNARVHVKAQVGPKLLKKAATIKEIVSVGATLDNQSARAENGTKT